MPGLDDESEQRASVYAKVAEVRGERNDFRSSVREGSADLVDIFTAATSSDVLATMKLLPLIEVIPDVGKVQSRRALAAVGLEDTVLVQDVDVDLRVDLGVLLVGPRL
jgi:hypothetical protein